MKLVGELNEKVAKANNKAEAKEIIRKAGMELNDDELELISGGEYRGRGWGTDIPNDPMGVL